ncbi:MAG: Hg(II)-responsive transcriptional regulator [Betaproteobacteria bacterium]|nr:Hg(II)-responsive transcriptional regulator [Betaproteobacteria bacterium]
MTNDNLTIGQVAESAGVHVETIRYYQRQALVDEPARPLGGIRRYDDRYVARLRFIKRAQQLGFTLEEVRGLLQLDDGQNCQDARVLAERKLADVEAKLKDLRTMHRHLKSLVTQCQSVRGRVGCPLIESLSGLEIGKRRKSGILRIA